MAETTNSAASTQAPAPKPQVKGNRETVVVGCKLPHGLFLDMRDRDGRPVRVKLNGCAVPVMATKWRQAPGHQIESAAGLTTVDKELFDAWCEQHKDFDPLVKGFIFAAPKSEGVVREARNMAGEKTGFEPLSATGSGQIKPFVRED